MSEAAEPGSEPETLNDISPVPAPPAPLPGPGPALAGPALSLRGLTLRRRKRLAVQDLSLSLPAGALLAVLGPPGAGKTTLLEGIAGKLRVERGGVLLAGRDVAHLARRRRGVAFRPADEPLPGGVKLRRAIVRLGRLRWRGRAAAVAAALDMFDLAPLADSRLADLSPGERRLMRLAGALARREGLLLLDEPLAELDALARDRLIAALRSRVAAGGTVVLTTRDADLALALADRIAVLVEGFLLQDGPPAQLYEHPRDARVARLLGPANILQGVVRELRAGGFVWANGGRFLQAATGDRVRPPLGGPVTLCLRPERIALLPLEPEAQGESSEQAPDNVVSGQLLSMRLEPGRWLLQFATACGPILVRLPSWPETGLVPGQEFRLAWAANAARILITD